MQPMLPMQTTAKQSKIMFVAIEYGGQWPSNLQPDEGADLVMVMQVADEDPLVFARRLLTKIVNVLARGVDVVSAVLAVAPIFDLRHLESRCSIGRTLLRAFRQGSKCQLYLIEPNEATPGCRQQLLALAEGLLEDAATDSQIRVGSTHRTRITAARAGA